jgi:hypothetical protein
MAEGGREEGLDGPCLLDDVCMQSDSNTARAYSESIKSSSSQRAQ